eukprot:CAMPEP_0175509894 /NCGR_PEP_ID=MMETSP0096-20121207/11114_1 /TAXON_ID=311494 /ORGANISM="Alexandrium monilatum, Strain CCMP3105" /LENGTH=401 /DNA_ID=CAMNT_0016812065 /DNA_START=24 /DNA_END=1227 /DNA_ORIENTATION=-
MEDMEDIRLALDAADPGKSSTLTSGDSRWEVGTASTHESSVDLHSPSSSRTSPVQFPALTTMPPPRVPEVLEDEMDKLGVADDLLAHWEAQEVRAFLPLTAKPPETGAADLSVMAKVRGAALYCMQQILVDVGLPMEAWFDAATVFDAYLVQASRDGVAACVKRLPLVVTVIARMMKKDMTEVRPSPYSFIGIPAWVARHLAVLGHEVDVKPQISNQELALAEQAVLRSVQWRAHLPTLASWTTAYFKRLDVLTENERSEQIRTAWERTLLMGQVLIAKQVPTAECSPQRLARGLLVLSMMSAEPTNGTGAHAVPMKPLSLEIAAAASACTLQDDCRVAVAAVRRAGLNPWNLGAVAEAQPVAMPVCDAVQGAPSRGTPEVCLYAQHLFLCAPHLLGSVAA